MVQLLDYCVTNPNAMTRYHASDMCLHVHSNASYLSESEARSRAGSFFYLSNQQKDPNVTPCAESDLPPLNGSILVLSSIIKSVLSSVSEAELGALFYNSKEAAPLCIALEEFGNPQPTTPIQTDTITASGISNDTVEQRRSKSIDMRFH